MRVLRYIYEVYDKNNNFKFDFKDVSEGTVSFRSLADIKRTLIISFKGSVSNIDFLSDRIKAMIEIDGVINNVGYFLLSNPEIERVNDNLNYTCTCFDMTQILRDVRITSLFFVPKDSNIINVINNLLALYADGLYSIIPSGKTNNIDIEFKVGSTILSIVNELLAIANYTSLYTTGNGVITSEPYVPTSQKAISYDYKMDETSIVLNSDFTTYEDLSSTPNSWLAYTSNSQNAPLVATYTNNDVNSPTSIKNRGRIISAEPIEVRDIADQSTLNDFVKRQAQTDLSNRYGRLSMRTLINPVHGFLDRIKVNEIEYQQTQWEIELSIGGTMTHECRRVI